MKKEDLKTRIQTIGGLATMEEVRSELAKFQGELETDYEERDELQATNQNLTTDMETLRQANMRLFLQVGSKEDPGKKKTDEGKSDENLTYDNLFDDKGGLK